MDGSVTGQAYGFMVQTQAELWQMLAVALKAVAGDDPWASAWWMMAVGFIYGIVHAMGPGHGKLALGSWLAATRSGFRRGLGYAFLASMGQVTTAVVIVSAAAWIVEASATDTQAFAGYFAAAGFALVAVNGGCLIWRGLRRAAALQGGEALDPEAGYASDTSGSGGGSPRRKTLALRLSSGPAMIFALALKPSSGGLPILLFAYALNLAGPGIAAAYAMALGATITVGIAAFLAVLLSKVVIGFNGGLGKSPGGPGRGRVAKAEVFLTVAGGLIIALAGLAMLDGVFSGGALPLY